MVGKKGDVLASIASEVNGAIKSFTVKGYRLNAVAFEKQIKDVNSSVDRKKNKLVNGLCSALVKTVGVNLGRIPKEKLVESLRFNIGIIRKVVHKLVSINHYYATSFLDEMGYAKKQKHTEARKLAEARITVPEFNRLERNVYLLIDKIIHLDNKLLSQFKQREEQVEEDQITGAANLESIIQKQTELLYHLDAKLPPPQKLSISLIQRPHFDYWIATVLALLVEIKKSYQTEQQIMQSLRKESLLRHKIDVKIKHLMKEKSGILSIKEGRILMQEKVSRMDNNWRKCIHDWFAVAEL